ncbi:MAG: Gfo/Idh/MocA family oxidoreductase [Candidatus Latescibacteria bacterium]|nr:Gfo/Idh/MocA family oxidoreductase [Candidatus Latescibacterota bacterium]
MKPVRLGVIGCGVIGRRHVEAASRSPLIDVVAVADLREEVAREVAGQFGVGRVYGDGDTLLEDPDVEAVVLALPACWRTDLASRAFALGKHVLIEKPVAMNAEEVRRLIAARGALTAGCCSCRFRLFESARAVTAFLATGALGPLRVVRCRAISSAGEPPKTPPPAWRLKRSLNGGGIMSNWGCYDLDYVLGITGWALRPRTVLAQTWTVPPAFASYVAPGSDAETHVAAFILCEGGTALTFERGEMAPAQTANAWEIIGTHGALRLNMLPGQARQILHDEGVPGKGVVSRTVWEGEEAWTGVHTGPSQDFAEAIRANRPPGTSLEQALVVQQITDAIYASAERGGAVEIT